MRDQRIRLGVTLGLALALCFVLAGGHVPDMAGWLENARHGALTSDSDGSLEEIVIQYVPESAKVVGRVYRELLAKLDDEVVVYAVVPDAAAFRDLVRVAGVAADRLEPIVAGHAMTTWSRDRWLALAPAPRSPDGEVTLLSPRQEDGHLTWPARAGDQQIGDDLARALAGGVRSTRSALEFEGGDFVADDQTVFVTPRVAERNLTHRLTHAGLEEALTRVFQKRVVLLSEAPDHHAGMYLALGKDHTALVGDPSLARELAPARSPSSVAYDFSPETQALFDAVAQQVAAAGYRVLRMPVIPGKDGRTYETPLNVIQDERDDQRIAYVPSYRHAPALNRAAAAIWRRAGFEVRAIDCTDAYVQFGSLRCLVNVLRRRALAPRAAA